MMDEINLDFLKTPPKQIDNAGRTGSPFVFNEFDVKFGKKKWPKKFELAKNIAEVDELLLEIDKLKSKNLELQQQLKGYHVSAQKVQELYKQEKHGHSVAKQALDKLQKEHSKIDENLENMSLVNEQLKARLAEYDGRPISFENLVVKYVKVMTKFEEDEVNKYSQDKEKLREYCKAMNYKVPRAVSPKKSRSRRNKNKTQEAFVQCNLIDEISLKTFDYTTCKNKQEFQDQSIVCPKNKRDQASQYISTMITRQTNTEKVVQNDAQTMFPEPPAVDDILNSFSKWVNIRSVSPLLESPTRISSSKKFLKSSSSIGTCTMLCNIRRKIDYLPQNSSSNIKQEFLTPSASPTPNAYHTSTNGPRANTLSNNGMGNTNTSSLFSLFNSTTNSLEKLSFNAFNELWQIFGKMLLSLIQNSNAGTASTNQTSQFNQQQFLDWLLELYANSQAQNSTSNTAHSQNLDQRDNNVSVSPLIFNGTSVLSSNVLRPHPQKTLQKENVARSNERIDKPNEDININLVDNISNNPIVSKESSDSSTQISSSINNTINQISSKTNNTETINICESNVQEIGKNYSTKSDKKAKTKHTILDQIQELLPGIKLNKTERKSLKRLLKDKNHRKKSYENRTSTKLKEVDSKQSSVVILTNDNNVDDTTETAIDFLKTFAVDQQNNEPIEENVSEMEKMFFKQLSNVNLNENVASDFETSLTTEESIFLKPSSSFNRSSMLTKRKTKICQQIENKYQLLFGDTDSEEVEMENLQLKPRPVININLDLENSHNKRDNNSSTIIIQENPALEIVEYENYNDLKYAKSKFDGDGNLTCRVTEANMAQDSFIINENTLNLNNTAPITCTEISECNQRCHVTLRNATKKSLFISENNFYASQEISLPDIPAQILKDLECTNLHNNQFEVEKDSENLNSSLINNNNCIGNIENNLTNNMELSSDVYGVKEVYESPPKTIETLKTEAKKHQMASQEDTRKSEMLESYEIPAKQDPMHSIMVQNVDIVEEVIFKSLPKLNDELCSEDSMESQPIITSSTTLDTNDFEKDFELSSDNESVESENDESNKSINISETNKNSPYEERILSPSSSISEVEDQQEEDNSKMNLFKNELKISNRNSIIFSANVKNNDSSFPSPNKNQDMEKSHQMSFSKLNDCSKSHNIIESSSENMLEVDGISFDSFEEVGENKNKVPNYKEKMFTMKEQQTKEKQTAFIIQKEEVKFLQKNCVNESSSIQNYENEQCFKRKINNSFEEKIYADKDNLHDKNDNISLNLLSIKLSHSQYSCNETINSSACSVITVSDSSTNDELLKKEEILTIPKEKSCKRDLPKTSGLSALKLLDLNQRLKQQKQCNNFKQNVKEMNLKTEVRDSQNQIIIFDNKKKITLKKAADKRSTTKDEKFSHNILKTNATENLANSLCSTSTFSTKNTSEHKQILNTSTNKNELERLVTNQGHEAEPLIKTTTFEESFFTDINSMPNNKNPILYESMDLSDKFDLSDSLSIEDELMIDEELGEITSKQLQSNPLDISDVEDKNNCNDTLDSTNMSNLLNSSLFNEILTESINPIVNDLLQEDLVTTSMNPTTKSRRGRKRQSECLIELQKPCKRSQRLKAKQMILDESLNLSITPIELTTKHPYPRKNVLNRNTKSIMPKMENLQKPEILENENILNLGFFKEREVEDDKTNITNKSLNTKKSRETEAENDKTYTISGNKKNVPKHTSPNFLNKKTSESEQDDQNSLSPDDLANKQQSENFIYTDSPQSPPPVSNYNNHDVADPLVIIPLERPTQFGPQCSNLKLFDHLINSYKNEHQKQVLESICHKKWKREEQILKQFEEQIMLYCYDEMDLELYCTSTRLINKLLSICPDYHLIQKAVITVAQNASSPCLTEGDLPSVIQEMPPRHLSKCLQRLFTFLKNIVTRNGNFCQDLIYKIEILLFNPKQTENLSLQATLNLTQLYLMASKVLEYLQINKHPARLFIAKCLYFYLLKSIIMIHEVLIWYPTVLPHREDKTYDRSDALISVIQQILMNTKYDMDKTDLRGKLFLSKLRYEYHFEPFKPTLEEVVNVLVEKLKNSKFYNISLAFGLLCKRIGTIKTENFVINQLLLPLANEYYSLALKSNAYDKRIEVLLEIISMLVKPLPIETDTNKYFWEFSRFLNGFERQIIQEAALCSILRLQRFNMEYCYSLLCNFQPTFNLNTHTQAMLKSFLYRRPVGFWRNLKSKNLMNCN